MTILPPPSLSQNWTAGVLDLHATRQAGSTGQLHFRKSFIERQNGLQPRAARGPYFRRGSTQGWNASSCESCNCRRPEKASRILGWENWGQEKDHTKEERRGKGWWKCEAENLTWVSSQHIVGSGKRDFLCDKGWFTTFLFPVFKRQIPFAFPHEWNQITQWESAFFFHASYYIFIFPSFIYTSRWQKEWIYSTRSVVYLRSSLIFKTSSQSPLQISFRQAPLLRQASDKMGTVLDQSGKARQLR